MAQTNEQNPATVAAKLEAQKTADFQRLSLLVRVTPGTRKKPRSIFDSQRARDVLIRGVKFFQHNLYELEPDHTEFWPVLVDLHGSAIAGDLYDAKGLDISKRSQPSPKYQGQLSQVQRLAADFRKQPGPVTKREDIVFSDLRTKRLKPIKPNDAEVDCVCTASVLALSYAQERRILLEGLLSPNRLLRVVLSPLTTFYRIKERQLIDLTESALSQTSQLFDARDRVRLSKTVMEMEQRRELLFPNKTR